MRLVGLTPKGRDLNTKLVSPQTDRNCFRKLVYLYDIAYSYLTTF